MAEMCRLEPEAPADMTGAQRRIGWAQPLEATARKSTISSSRANVEFAQFTTSCMRKLREKLQSRVRERCAVIVAYKRQLNLYQSLFFELQKQEGETSAEPEAKGDGWDSASAVGDEGWNSVDW